MEPTIRGRVEEDGPIQPSGPTRRLRDVAPKGQHAMTYPWADDDTFGAHVQVDAVAGGHSTVHVTPMSADEAAELYPGQPYRPSLGQR